jgi:regulatory associated protein of mTOR
MVPVRGGSGMVMEWFQPTGTLLCGGDSKVVRVWDANTEVSAAVSDRSGSASCSAMGPICSLIRSSHPSFRRFFVFSSC